MTEIEIAIKSGRERIWLKYQGEKYRDEQADNTPAGRKYMAELVERLLETAPGAMPKKEPEKVPG